MLPESLVDYFVAFRFRTDLRSLNVDQAVLCDFITAGHLGRHLRRMRNIYAGRLGTLIEVGREYMQGLLEISGIQAGLYTAAFLRNGMSSREAETQAAAHGIDLSALDRFSLKAPDPNGLLLGFAAFDEVAIRSGLIELTAALSVRSGESRAQGRK